jgi:hypothetical protein
MNWRVKAQFPEPIFMVAAGMSESSPFITGYFYDFSLLEVEVRGHLGLKPHFGLVPDDAMADLHPRSLGFQLCPAGRDSVTEIAHLLIFSLRFWRRY